MQISENASLKSLNSFGIPVNCRYLIQLEDPEETAAILSNEHYRQLPRLILGGGSNILFTKDFEGLVIAVSNTGIKLVDENEQNYYVQAAAGENWHEFVLYCIRQGWAGLENLSLIPGTVGAAPIQNIGAYGVELSDRFHGLNAIDMHTGEAVGFQKDDCRFGYRDSLFKQQPGRYLITDVTVELAKQPRWVLDYAGIRESLDAEVPITARLISETVCKLRQNKLPNPDTLGNVGSFFKNPIIAATQYQQLAEKYPGMPAWQVDANRYKISAAWLIEQRGWKGKRRGDTGVYPEHALVMVNYGHANGVELWQLARDIIQSVEEYYDVRLEPEPLIL